MRNYVEPFAGSCAVLLARPPETWVEPPTGTDPGRPGTETVNDASRFLANFWRALATDPDSVADHASWPVNECDLHARHQWLVGRLPEMIVQLDRDPDWFDPKIAGRWVWGSCAWIGSGWCPETPRDLLPRKLPHLKDDGQGVHRSLPRQLPHLKDDGQGVHGQGIGADLRGYLRALAARLRRVRVACGDWTRVLGGGTIGPDHGLTGVFLDPPYGAGDWTYSTGYGEGVGPAVGAWALANGRDPRLRIVVAGLEGQHPELDGAAGWRRISWVGPGGYGRGDLRFRERLWLSPGCLPVAGSVACGDGDSEPPEDVPPELPDVLAMLAG